jgi:hypothetical protein
MQPRPSSDLGRITVPKLNRDPIQSLCPFPVEVDVAGLHLLVPAMPASEWLSVLMSEDLDLSDVFPGLLNGADTDALEDKILEGHLDIGDLEETILGIIETVSARHWWVTLRLIETARTSWDVLGGELGLRGVDPTHVSLSHWLDILLLVTIRSMDPKDVQMFSLRLEAPPPEVQVDEAEMEMSESSFMAMAR